MRPQNSVRDSGYLTPDSIPDERICRSFSIPNNTAWLGVFMGALVPLLLAETWQQYGTLTPDECAAQWQEIFFSWMSACETQIEAPYWDDGTDVGLSEPASTQTWYGFVEDILAPPDGITFEQNVAIWAFTGFIAASGEIGAAIAFHTIAPKFVLAWQRGDVGEVFRVILDSAEAGTLDTSAATEGDILNMTLAGDPALDGHDIYLIKVS